MSKPMSDVAEAAKQIRERKRTLNRNINDLLMALTEETGLVVSDITIRHYEGVARNTYEIATRLEM